MTDTEAILGRALIDGNTVRAKAAGVTRDTFNDERHRAIWDAIAAVETSGAVDLVTLTQRLHETGQLVSVGSVPYLIGLCEKIPATN